MMVQTNQLFCIKEATNVKHIYLQEHEAQVQERKKTLVQSLKQFHAHFCQLYKKGMTHVRDSLLGLHSRNALRCPNISASMGLKSFWPWCYKLGRNTETTFIHLWEVHCRMVIMCDICQAFAGMTIQNILGY